MSSMCLVCRTPTSILCSGCKRVYYCNVKCQTKDWKRHKKECKIWRKELNRDNDDHKHNQEYEHNGFIFDNCGQQFWATFNGSMIKIYLQNNITHTTKIPHNVIDILSFNKIKKCKVSNSKAPFAIFLTHTNNTTELLYSFKKQSDQKKCYKLILCQIVNKYKLLKHNENESSCSSDKFTIFCSKVLLKNKNEYNLYSMILSTENNDLRLYESTNDKQCVKMIKLANFNDITHCNHIIDPPTSRYGYTARKNQPHNDNHMLCLECICGHYLMELTVQIRQRCCECFAYCFVRETAYSCLHLPNNKHPKGYTICIRCSLNRKMVPK
eukprot:260842_1